MIEQKTVILPANIAPNKIQFIGCDNFSLNDYIEKFSITQAEFELQDEVTLKELGFNGKPDLSNLKVEYPVTLELQQDGQLNMRVAINVPYLDEKGVKPVDEVQPLREDQEL